ncbi:hypothetical protein B0H14DRAFT_501806 [Mycena olivaceomarginata]|nr:hypothetical protein B0H14DRAFT_501806 [Mycena olivaceomarginata]
MLLTVFVVVMLSTALLSLRTTPSESPAAIQVPPGLGASISMERLGVSVDRRPEGSEMKVCPLMFVEASEVSPDSFASLPDSSASSSNSADVHHFLKQEFRLGR